MTTVPTDFHKHGWHYRQLKRVGNVAIYEQGGGAAYEVVRIRVAPERTFKGRTFPAGEYLPCDSEWGRYGFTLHTLAEAHAKMAILTLADEQNDDFAAHPTKCGACLSRVKAA